MKPGENYPEDVRQFCLSVHYHSPRAYEEIRNQFKNHLPHPATIASWYRYSNTNGEIGLNNETLERLKKIANDVRRKSGHQLVCSLIFDEMYIRKQVFWCNQTQQYLGYVTYGNKGDTLEVATQALVFMLSGINQYFEFPLAYHFISSLNATEKASLLTEIIGKITEQDVRVINVTFDGYASNGPMCERLGANLNVDSDDFKPYFEFGKNKIYVVFDPAHMEKLLRNTLASKEILYDDNDERIEWKYFVELEKMREKNFITHKLNRKHTEWKRNIMNVRIAAETLSKSVSDSMTYLRENKHLKFIDSAATSRFVDKMDKLFDVCNSRSPTHYNVYKRAMNSENKRIIQSFFTECITYLKSLKVMTDTGKKILIFKSRNKTAFKGYIINMVSP